ncbi:MAG: hypothetical protein NTV51_15620 [Verrucomicrobia bacterium]|nr:hypothetical protein [Verrucomicrobiota bacterium]
MRFLFLLCVLAGGAMAAVPAELAAALKTFRTDAPRGWSFTQTTEGEGRSRVERFDAARPEFDRWTLLQQDGRAVSVEEQTDYKQKLTRRSSNATAPLITDQLDLSAPETVSDTAERATYRCRLKPGEAGDKTAAFLGVTLIVHKPTHTVESLEISSSSEFKPTWGVTIAEMKTVMTYSLPVGEAPSLPQKVTTRLRGRAFWVKSLDADMTVAYADYAKAGKK